MRGRWRSNSGKAQRVMAASVLNSVNWPESTGRWFRGFEFVVQWGKLGAQYQGALRFKKRPSGA